MNRTSARMTRSMMACATAFGGVFFAVTPASLAQNAGTTDSIGRAVAGPTTADSIERASRLIGEGMVVRGRAILVGLADAGRAQALTDAERTRAASLLGIANSKLAQLDPLELSLQKAEVALDESDLRTAERHAARVRQSSLLTPEQRSRADAVAEAVIQTREGLAPKAPAIISQAAADLREGRVAQARAALDSLFRSGVSIPENLQSIADDCRTRIIAIEQGLDPISGVHGSGSVGFAPAVLSPVASQPADDAADPQPADPVADARRFEATNLLVEADKAFESGRFNEAVTRYGQLLAGYREFLSADQAAHVEQRITQARLKLDTGPRDPLGDVVKGRTLVKQQTLAEFSNQLAQSKAALATGDTARARELAAGARFTLNNGRDNFSDAELETLNRQVTDTMSEIEVRTQELIRLEQDTRSRELADRASRAQADIARDRENKIREHLLRARDLQREMKYREALQVVDQILFLDPINPAGLILRDIIEDAHIYTSFHRIRDDQSSSYALQALDNERAMIAPESIINYPTDWPATSARRGEPIQFAETPEDRRVRGVLESRRIPVSFRNNTLRDVLGFFQTVSNLDVDIDWPSLESIGITEDTPVSLELRNVVLRSVLDRVMAKIGDDNNRAGWEISDGVLRIASEQLLRKNTVTLVYDIRDLLLEVPDYTNAPEFDLQSVLQSTGQGGGGGGQSPFRDTNQDRGQDARRPLQDRTNDLLDIIQQNVDPEGWIDAGGTTGRVQSLNGNLIITNTPKNHQAIDGLLRKLREVRAMQINVESRFLLVNTEFFEQIGFDIDVYFNANNNQVRAARANDPTIQASDFFANNGSLNRAVTGSGIDTDGDGNVDTFVTQGVVNPRPWSPIGVSQNSSQLASSLIPREGFVGDILSGTPAPALGIAGQFLDDIQVDFLIQATQADRRSVRLTAPRLTFTNGQVSNIYVATQTAFVSDLTPIVSDSAVGFDPQLATLNEGVVMLLEGTISSDRRYVTLNVDVAVSKLEGFQNRAVTAVAGGQLVSSADTQSFIQAPTVTVTRVQTTVTVPDQGTILIGGQRLINEVEAETGVPVLSKIPILNRFFSNRIQVKEEQTLIVLIKPTILIQNEEEERNFPGLADTIRAGLGG
ncbi:MAG: hypothetical protein KF787_04765 [Phycisphaeraceae bacterium]|nr:hypothetical protein [Phycisphaeraceae bacterium]